MAKLRIKRLKTKITQSLAILYEYYIKKKKKEIKSK